MRRILLLFTILSVLLFAGCTQSTVPQESHTEHDTIKVVTTLFPLYEFAREVGGDRVEVTLLLPPGMEPHSFSPKPSDIVAIEEADVFLYIGDVMEPWAHDILEGLNNDDLEIIDASSLVDLLESEHHHHHDEHGDEHADEHSDHEDEKHDEHSDEHDEEHEESEHADEHDEEHHEEVEHADEHDEHEEHEDHSDHEDEHDEHGEETSFDPHIWLDLSYDQIIVAEVGRVFSTLDSAHVADFAANAGAYNARLAALDERYMNELSSCAQDEFLVGGHNFFGYIEARYNIEGIAAIENLAPSTEPTPQKIKEITDVASEHGIKYILTEVLVSTQMAEAIASEAGAEVLTFNPSPNLEQEAIDRGKTFISVMEGNLETLKTVLECN